MDAFQGTGLWKTSLGRTDLSGGESTGIATLLSTFNTMRDRASQLTSRIASNFPELTVHDKSHLDALWETASLIAGDNYPLNPMEGFVFGGAIMLHDAALCFEAFNGGREGIRKTIEWLDYNSAIASESPTLPPEEVAKKADFSAIRYLHARQAEHLGTKGWCSPSGSDIHLIDNDELRSFYGRVIGQIAASHHWSYDDLSKLPKQVNAPGTYPIDWRVDPLKLACLLRVADAAHIDSRRAPDFLYALLRREGISADHWKAQNWLARADKDLSDPAQETLIITSNHGFAKEDASAWWVAYDAICLIDDELRQSAAMLGKRPQVKVSPPFALKRVAGAGSPEQASKFLEVSGWAPCAAKIHVGNVEKLVRDLGGEKLYGSEQKLLVVIRELIQNARDAITARVKMDPGFVGRVQVCAWEEENSYYIRVSDDGIGMSERVLTGPLLDFGTSFWTTSLAQEEFPGLRSSSFSSSGRFGIGFYSVFMASSSVTVSSRRWDRGLESIRSLSFPNGLSLRPIMSSGRPSDFASQNNTEVTILVSSEEGDPRKIAGRRQRPRESPPVFALEKIIESLCVGVDVQVQYSEGRGRNWTVIHNPVTELAGVDEVRSIFRSSMLAVKIQQSAEFVEALDNDLSRARKIIIDGKLRGFAALPTSTRVLYSSGIHTVGGFRGDLWSQSSTNYVGYIDREPHSARRDQGYLNALDLVSLQPWLKEQVDLLVKQGADEQGWYIAGSAIADWGLNPPSEFCVPVATKNDTVYLSVPNLADLMIKAGGLAVYKAKHAHFVDPYHNLNGYENLPTFLPYGHGAMNQLELDEEGKFPEFSLARLLQEHFSLLGFDLSVDDTRPELDQAYFGVVVWVLTPVQRQS